MGARRGWFSMPLCHARSLITASKSGPTAITGMDFDDRFRRPSTLTNHIRLTARRLGLLNDFRKFDYQIFYRYRFRLTNLFITDDRLLINVINQLSTPL